MIEPRAFELSMCGRADIHLPHMWECRGGVHSHVGTTRCRYYCKGEEPREKSAREPIPTRISL